MTDFPPGWFPHPDDPNARRYWDGTRWSAPLPKDPPPAPIKDHDAALQRRAEGMRSDDPEVRRAAVRESAAQRTPCIVPNCPEHVVPGSAYCQQHRPTQPCALGPCSEPRLPRLQFCARHSRHGSLTSITAAPTPPPARPIQEFAGVTNFGGRRAIVCPHCGEQGRVSTQQVRLKRGVSGAKLTGAIFTAGISMVGTGLSRKEQHTEMHCGNCGMTWVV